MSPINPFYCICAECFKYRITSSKRGPGFASRLFAIKPYKIKFLIRKQNVFFCTECQTVLYFCTVADTFYTLELSGRRDTFLSLREVFYYYIYRLGWKVSQKKFFSICYTFKFNFFLPQNSEPARSLIFKSANPEKTSPLNSAGQTFTGPISTL